MASQCSGLHLNSTIVPPTRIRLRMCGHWRQPCGHSSAGAAHSRIRSVTIVLPRWLPESMRGAFVGFLARMPRRNLSAFCATRCSWIPGRGLHQRLNWAVSFKIFRPSWGARSPRWSCVTVIPWAVSGLMALRLAPLMTERLRGGLSRAKIPRMRLKMRQPVYVRCRRSMPSERVCVLLPLTWGRLPHPPPPRPLPPPPRPLPLRLLP